jgi:surfactin synthase thioesterase subunit
MKDAANPWLPRRPIRDEALLNLFCFPHAGGGAATYYRWSHDFPGEIEVLPILLPGRERRLAEPAVDSIPKLTGALAENLAPHLSKPFAFFGHSMGSLIAFELTRLLRRRGMALPRRLFVAAFRAPQLAATSSPIRGLPDSEFVAAMQDRFEGIPPQIAKDPDLLALFLPALRADITAIETYQYNPESPLECPITVLGGVEDRQVSAADLAGWRSQTTGEFNQTMLPGGHFFVSQHSAEVSRIVRSRLERRPV